MSSVEGGRTGASLGAGAAWAVGARVGVVGTAGAWVKRRLETSAGMNMAEDREWSGRTTGVAAPGWEPRDAA
ncbi:hypothetical protein MFU01_69110 [Myxococcus fulvus]|uniref:Uncharacterized protein n=1 Tax=Myxococcus fulvus TaxID=33 RepID=A0A511TCH1_MYXFU|nr:hypothetical protein MFU01_69110 [Myxococcus fulvus]